VTTFFYFNLTENLRYELNLFVHKSDILLQGICTSEINLW
jgi:hypothetical protein